MGIVCIKIGIVFISYFVASKASKLQPNSAPVQQNDQDKPFLLWESGIDRISAQRHPLFWRLHFKAFKRKHMANFTFYVGAFTEM